MHGGEDPRRGREGGLYLHGRMQERDHDLGVDGHGRIGHQDREAGCTRHARARGQPRGSCPDRARIPKTTHLRWSVPRARWYGLLAEDVGCEATSATI